MLRLTVLLIVALLIAPLPAGAKIKPCEELRAEIDAKLKKKGVKNYTLEIFPKGTNFEGDPNPKHIVGSCDGGTNQIFYTRL